MDSGSSQRLDRLKPLRLALFFAKELALGRDTRQWIQTYADSQTWPVEKMQVFQAERLRRLMARVEFSPLLREKYRHHGIRPGDIRTLGDLRCLPLLEKEEVRLGVTALTCADASEMRTLVRRTSGSTGARLQYLGSHAFAGPNLAQVVRGQSWWGVAPWSRTLKIFGTTESFDSSTSGRIRTQLKRVKDYALGVVHRSAFDSTIDGLELTMQQYIKQAPALIYGYGNAIAMFGEHCRQAQTAIPSPNAVIYTSETLTPGQRERISQVFRAPVICEYGAVETGIISYQCRFGAHHIADECLIVEVRGADGQVRDEGVGQIVVTSLNELVTPFVRYVLGDVVELLPRGSRCDCGSTLRIISNLRGRANDIIVAPSGRQFHPELFDYFLRFAPAQIERLRVYHTESDKIHVVIQTRCELGQSVCSDLLTRMTDLLGGEFAISISQRRQIENEESGKFRWFVPLPSGKSETGPDDRSPR